MANDAGLGKGRNTPPVQLHHGLALGPQLCELLRPSGRGRRDQPVTLFRCEEDGQGVRSGEPWCCDLQVDADRTIANRDDAISLCVRQAEGRGPDRRAAGNVGFAEATQREGKCTRRDLQATREQVPHGVAHDEVRVPRTGGGHGGRACRLVLGPHRMGRPHTQLNEGDVDRHAPSGSRSGRPVVSRLR